ncbi:MAG TPA: isocitrate lyase/PEP mutase family protein, partial [Alphaproteobacteria bacterium]|nr:isocitrate lyase/PEP mutase family protein [Alphaproteobacteria bacterium]
AAGEFVVAPGVFDMISALSADRMGFSAIYMTGYGISASHLGLPDAGLVTYTDMVGRVETIARGTRTPLIADADTGFGGLLNVEHTVKGYERAGAAAIQIEDQEYPKRCGHTPGRRVVPVEDMVRKIRVAVEARDSRDFLIVARTDARTSHGLDEAIRRGEAFAEAGADVLFIESPENEEEMATVCSRLKGTPLLANMVEGGRTPVLPKARLEEMGYQISIHPGSAFMAAAAACKGVYEALEAHGSTVGCETPLLPFSEMNTLVGFDRIWAFEKQYPERE